MFAKPIIAPSFTLVKQSYPGLYANHAAMPGRSGSRTTRSALPFAMLIYDGPIDTPIEFPKPANRATKR
jgi:hypothetical protein